MKKMIYKTKKEIEDVVGIETTNAIPCSGKTGEGIENILEAIINKLPAPKGISNEKLKCLLVDSWYDSYLGVVILVRVINGKLKKDMKIKLMSNNRDYVIEKVGVFTPKPNDIEEYKQYKYNLSNFVFARNQRMENLYK